MKTRSATKALRVEEEEEAAEPLPLDKLAPEVLNIIAEALAADEDILIPRHLGSLARSCKVIKEAVRDAKDKLKVKYDAARALVVKCGDTVERIVEGAAYTSLLAQQRSDGGGCASTHQGAQEQGAGAAREALPERQ